MTVKQNKSKQQKRSVSESQVSFVNELLDRRPDLRPVIRWLKQHDADPEPMVAGASAKLHKRERYLPEPQRDRYFAAVLFNEFLTRWVRHNRGKKVSDWVNRYAVLDEEAYESELKPFELVVTMLCDAGAFKKQVPKLVQETEAKRSNIHYGDGDGFAGYAADNTWLLANRLLVNFNPNRRNANRYAVNYLLKTAMSCYLKYRSEDPNYATAGMLGYLKESKIDPRNVIAYKLVYSPSHLDFEERKWLRENHGIKDLTKRYRGKDVAALLGYKNAQSLYRKLNKMRKWAELDLIAEATTGGEDA